MSSGQQSDLLLLEERKGAMQPSPRMGRPPSLPETVRSNRVVTLLTDQELEKLRRFAERKSLSLSGAVRELLTRRIEHEPKELRA